MKKTKTLNSPVNRWVLLTSVGIIATAAGYGIFELCNQQSIDTDNFPEIPILNNSEGEKETVEDNATTTTSSEPIATEKVEEGKATVENSVQVPEISSVAPAKQVSQTDKDQYPIDQTYLNKVGSRSIARKYKDYMVLSPVEAPIWEKKAKKLIDMAEKNKYKSVWTGWYGYWQKPHINAQSVHKLCSLASSYSEWGIFWNLFAGKSYFNFLWEACGREDKPKPSGWWYR